MKRLLLVSAALAALSLPVSASAADKLLNASYDIAREIFAAQNEAFIKANPGVTIDQSHGGTSRQARAIVEGLEADVVTFNQVTDVEFLAKNGFINEGWQGEFPNNASPYTSTIVFLVREGNPKGLKDWGDLVADGVDLLTFKRLQQELVDAGAQLIITPCDADPSIAALSGNIAVRFADQALVTQAINGEACTLEFEYAVAGGAGLKLTAHAVYLPIPRIEIAGPQGVQASFDWQAAKATSPARMCTAVLVNTVTGY